MPPSKYRPPEDIPEIEGLPASGQRQLQVFLRRQFLRLAEDLDVATRNDAPTIVYTDTRIDVPAGAKRRVTPAAAGMTAVLEAPSQFNAGSEVVLFLEAPRGSLSVISAPGIDDGGKVFLPTVNGARRATYTAAGVITLRSNGSNAWSSPSEIPKESPASFQQLIASTPGTPGATGAQGQTGLGTALFPLLVENDRSEEPGQFFVAPPPTPPREFQAVIGPATWTDFDLAAAFPGIRSGDFLGFQLTGDLVINTILPPTLGFWCWIGIRFLSGGDFKITIKDQNNRTGGTLIYVFRTPGTPKGDTPATDFVLQSEEAWVAIGYTPDSQAWRIMYPQQLSQPQPPMLVFPSEPASEEPGTFLVGQPGSPGATGATGATGAAAPLLVFPGEPPADEPDPFVVGQQGAQGIQGATGATGAAGTGSAYDPLIFAEPLPEEPGTFLVGQPGGVGATGATGATGAAGVSPFPCFPPDLVSEEPGPLVPFPTALGLPVIQPGSFIGLQITAAGAATAIEITGAESGQNLRLNTWATDTSVGNQADFVIGTGTTGVGFTPATALNLQGLAMAGSPIQGKLLVLAPQNTAAPVTLEHASASEATASRKFQLPGQLNLTLFQNENAVIQNDSNAGRMRLFGLARARSAVQQDSGPIFTSTISPVETLNFVGAGVSVASGVATITVSPATSTQMNEEFCSFQSNTATSAGGDTTWAQTGSGGSSIANRSTNDANHPGAWALTTGATLNNQVGISKGGVLGDTPFLLTNMRYFRWVVMLRTGNTQLRAYFGLFKQAAPFAAANSADSICAFGIETAAAAGNWLAVTCSGSVLSAASTGVTAALNTWYTLELYVTNTAGATSQLDYFVNGVKTNTVTNTGANIPITGMNFVAGSKTLDANTKVQDLDNACMRFAVTR